LMSCVPAMLLGYFLNDLEIFSLPPVIIGTTSAFGAWGSVVVKALHY
jgi:hypothetical protein